MSIKEQLLAVLRSRVDQGAWTWLSTSTETAATGGREQLLLAYTAASHHAGSAPLNAPAVSLPAGVILDGWRLEDAARAILLLSRAEASRGAEDFVSDATACYEEGDAGEQQSWLRTVGALPDSQRFLPTVIDACRSSVQPIFEAVACENPYPAQFFPERNFNQMILKALFNGVSLRRVAGLAGRLNPELSRMATDYEAERRAAGRTIPADIGLVILTPAHRDQ
jgi:hypothetical protein